MSTILQFRRDTAANLASIIGADGELFIDETNKTLVIGDGITLGGHSLPSAGMLANLQNQVTSTIANNSYFNAVNLTQNNNIAAVSTLAQAAWNSSNTVNLSLTDSNTLQTAINLTQNTQISTINVRLDAAYTQANTARTNVNAATILAQAAFDSANVKFSSTGGTITGATTFSAPMTITSTLESINVISSPGQTATLDLTKGSIFYLSGLTSNVTATFINATLTSNTAVGTVVNIAQGSTAYIANVVSINGTTQPIKWLANTVPTGTANKNDVISFTFIVTSNVSNVTVLGSLSTYG